jgi:glycosyltransferase involved in cell wall biosynthesis
VNTVHVVLPAGADDPSRPSGGQVYNRRVCRGLATAGWAVDEHPVPGSWPWPDAVAEQGLADELAALRDGAVVLIDGLVASPAARVVVPAAGRLAVVVLVHLPLGEQFPGHRVDGANRREGEMLSAARAVITTSEWTRARLLERYALCAASVQVARPGAQPAEPAPGTATGGELLCVAAVAPHKGHDVLVAALAALADRAWRCRLVGPLDRDPGFVARLRAQAQAGGVGARIGFSGPRTGVALGRAYARADVFVLASHAETYGMVITEALAHGLPVIATAVGGLPEALGTTPDGRRPGLLVPPGDGLALAAALRSWLDDADLRRRLRGAAYDRRPALAGWDQTCARVGSVLAAVAGRPVAGAGAP